MTSSCTRRCHAAQSSKVSIRRISRVLTWPMPKGTCAEIQLKSCAFSPKGNTQPSCAIFSSKDSSVKSNAALSSGDLPGS